MADRGSALMSKLEETVDKVANVNIDSEQVEALNKFYNTGEDYLGTLYQNGIDYLSDISNGIIDSFKDDSSTQRYQKITPSDTVEINVCVAEC